MNPFLLQYLRLPTLRVLHGEAVLLPNLHQPGLAHRKEQFTEPLLIFARR